jgi:hypothetical protein
MAPGIYETAVARTWTHAPGTDLSTMVAMLLENMADVARIATGNRHWSAWITEDYGEAGITIEQKMEIKKLLVEEHPQLQLGPHAQELCHFNSKYLPLYVAKATIPRMHMKNKVFNHDLKLCVLLLTENVAGPLSVVFANNFVNASDLSLGELLILGCGLHMNAANSSGSKGESFLRAAHFTLTHGINPNDKNAGFSFYLDRAAYDFIWLQGASGDEVPSPDNRSRIEREKDALAVRKDISYILPKGQPCVLFIGRFLKSKQHIIVRQAEGTVFLMRW